MRDGYQPDGRVKLDAANPPQGGSKMDRENYCPYCGGEQKILELRAKVKELEEKLEAWREYGKDVIYSDEYYITLSTKWLQKLKELGEWAK